ncbi:bifunctional proline dehydrogenase/L-glutamate gamma-semialdehyde dehydrogenase [Pseudarthrobacter sp. J1763]|uniref:bifunctional proline dehydrogenase/L-glutamate gamma-semialdehyde dehydrogenase n=1 Tax=Pseudarthrobacter sp. J1763 TaxID=3420445 RepID=UPI003D2A1B63
MTTPSFIPVSPRPHEVANDAVALVHKWLGLGINAHKPEAPKAKEARKLLDSAALLAEVLKDPKGLDFTIGFVDRVIRPEDLNVAAGNLAALAGDAPSFLPWYMKAAVRTGGVLAPKLPWLVVPASRAVLRQMVSHLIVDARPKQLGTAINKLRADGTRLNVNLLGEAVLGDAEADARLAGTRELLAREDVDYVSIKVSSVVSQLNMWAYQETVEKVSERLLPLYQLAADSAVTKFINLDMEEYHDLHLTVDVFKRILSNEKLKNLEAGIVLQAYLPDALAVLQDLSAWAAQRKQAGGAGIKVRLVKGANLAMERVDAQLHGWELATVASKQDADTNYKRCLDWALTPEHTAALRLGVAGHNLFDIAFAHELSVRRGVADRIEFEMLLGMAEEQATEVRKDVGELLLYTPVVRPKQFDVAISYLIRRLEENASQDNFMSAVFELDSSPELLERETQRFLNSLHAMDTSIPAANRHQEPTRAPAVDSGTFINATDSDSSLPNIRQWATEVLSRVETSSLGVQLIQDSAATTTEAVDALITRATSAQKAWASSGGNARAQILRQAAVELSARRAELIEVAANETGKTLAEGDVEISEAVDFANFYALGAEKLEQVQGARFVPSRLTVVTPPWNFPIAITAGSVLAPLAAGSSVIIKPAPQAKRCAAVVVEALWNAGVPRDVLILADVEEGPLGQRLISHPAVDRVILTGAYDTAKLFKSWRHDLPLLAETSGKNSIIVTPSADLDVAANFVVKSAFGHAGQKCSAASLVILVGSVATSERFRHQLLDAAASLKVGFPSDPETEMGPIIEPASGKLKDALTTLGGGEQWLLEPRKLDTAGRLYSPGIRTGVAPQSYFHLTEFFGPVLGVMTAATLEEAIELQNASAYGLTAGLHTMDPAELQLWLGTVQAGNLYVNRGITGAIVQRQPFGGWKRSSVGAGAKAGGPNYLMHLGHWDPVALDSVLEATPLAQITAAITMAESDLGPGGVAMVSRAAAEDQFQWDNEFGINRDVSALAAERNVFRYLPVPVELRLGSTSANANVLRVAIAGVRAGAKVTLSVPTALPPALSSALLRLGVRPVVENEADWSVRVAGLGSCRVRLVGDDDGAAAAALFAASEGSPDVAIYAGPVTEAGRVELLPFVHEQAVTITAHRFGNPDNVSATVLQNTQN